MAIKGNNKHSQLIILYNTTNVKNMHLHRDSNPGSLEYRSNALTKTSMAKINSIAMETSIFLFKGTCDDIKFKLEMTSYSHVYTALRYPLEGIDLFRVQATKISFKNKQRKPRQFLRTSPCLCWPARAGVYGPRESAG